MGAYFDNSRKTILSDLLKRRRAAEARADRYRRSYGEVGCYDDMVEVIHMLDDLVAVVDDDIEPPTVGNEVY